MAKPSILTEPNGVKSTLKILSIAFVVCALPIVLKAQKLDKDVRALILLHQPHVKEILDKSSSYSWADIKKAFNDATLEGKKATFQKGKQFTTWRLDDKQRVTSVTFKFDVSAWKLADVEKNLLKKYKTQLTPEEYAKVPSSSRTLDVKDPKEKLEMEIYFPVSDFESPVIRSVTLEMADRK